RRLSGFLEETTPRPPGRVGSVVRRRGESNRPARRDAMSGNSDQNTTAGPLTRGQEALCVGVLAAAGVLWFVSLETPIPSGKENRQKAGAFLKERFPDREVSPHDSKSPQERLNAPVAVVYELIRSGEPEVARRAIGFAAEQ